MLLALGFSGVILRCLNAIRFANCRNSSPLNGGPESDLHTVGTPNKANMRFKRGMTAFAVRDVSNSVIGNYYSHL